MNPEKNNESKSPDSHIWNAAIEHGKTEVPEITDNRPAIRAVLREARNKRGVKVRTQSYLP